MDCNHIINQFYQPDTPLYRVLTEHSMQVALFADECCERLLKRGTPIDADFVHEAALLHDIGICRTDAPGIYCTGTEPYICHGVLGRAMLDQLGLFRHALVCERHTGAGLSIADIEQQHLPLPHRDLLPITLEEKLVCYADKFFSKNHLGEPPRTLERVRQQMARFGEDSLARFDAMHELFA